MNQRRIPPADSRRIEKYPAELILLRELRQIRSLFRNRDELPPGLRDSSRFQLLQKVQQQRVAFDLLSGFAGENKKRSFIVQSPLARSHRSGIGAVQNKNPLPALGHFQIGDR